MKKRCSECGRELPLSEFYPQKSGKCGVSSRCKRCTGNIGKIKRLENKIRRVISSIIGEEKPTAYRAYNKELEGADVEFKPHLKEELNYMVVVSQVQDCWINVKARSKEEAVFKVYSALYSGDVYMEDEVVFGKNAKLESVELDEIPDDEDYVDIKYKEDEK